MKKDLLASALATLFCAYGKIDDIERQKVYYKALQNMDHGLVLLACQKAILNNVFLPSISEIFTNAKNIEYEINPLRKTKDWDEVVIEINKAVTSSSTVPFNWSSPEIEQAVRTYGLTNLRYGPASSYSYALETIRKNYIQICSRKSNSEQNSVILEIVKNKIKNHIETQNQIENNNLYLLSSKLFTDLLEAKRKE